MLVGEATCAKNPESWPRTLNLGCRVHAHTHINIHVKMYTCICAHFSAFADICIYALFTNLFIFVSTFKSMPHWINACICLSAHTHN